MPRRPGQNADTATDPTNNARATDAANLPPGLTAPPARAGVSPLSGLPVSNLPAVSAGTAPIGPDAAIPPATSAEETVTRRRQAATPATDPAAVAARPQFDTQVGTVKTSVVPTPPPTPRAEVAPRTSAETGQVWVGGYYSWQAGQWTWVDGSWQRPPRQGSTWIPGSYDRENKRWTEGRWDIGEAKDGGRSTPAAKR